jgi:putative transposase
MPRSPRADEAGGLYHALNRGNLRATIFHKDGDYAAFEKILHEALQLYQVHLLAYQLMPNHYHLERKKERKRTGNADWRRLSILVNSAD